MLGLGADLGTVPLTSQFFGIKSKSWLFILAEGVPINPLKYRDFSALPA
jgi:hypothetical protein